MSLPYSNKPKIIFRKLEMSDAQENFESYCVGFELGQWRCESFADNLIEWIIDYALMADELETLNHTNWFTKARQAASRVYTSEKYKRRGEVGEISAHAICRSFFDTIPIAPRVHYLSASNDPVKAFDLVHVRYLSEEAIELWLGEAKFFQDRKSAVRDAIKSVKEHIEQGFLKNEKILLGPQVSKNIPLAEKIRDLLSSETSLDELFANAVFPILIAANSEAVNNHTSLTNEYNSEISKELNELSKAIAESGLEAKIKILFIYVPLGSKEQLAKAFDDRLKGFQK